VLVTRMASGLWENQRLSEYVQENQRVTG